MKISELMNKRIGGVPVLYIAAGVMIIVAFFVWRMKPFGEDASVEDAGMEEGATDTVPDDPYDSLRTGGTVVVQPQDPKPEEKVERTNDDWFREATKWLVDNNKSTPSEAEDALTTYLRGEDMSYEQGKLKDEAIKAIGFPPEPLGSVGKVGQPIAQKQFSIAPGRHTIKGTADNTYAQLARLYYGRDDVPTLDLIQGYNPRLGNSHGPFAVGETIAIPSYAAPKFYYSTSANNTAEKIGAVNGRPAESIVILNDGMKFPVKPNTKVRVR